MNWDEQTLREAVDWRAWKRGREIVERGRLPAVRRRGPLLSARFGSGRAAVATVVRVGDGALEVECGCAENRRGGAICAHAVALVLDAIRGGEEAAPEKDEPAAAAVPERALRLGWSKGFDRELARGRLSLRLEPVDEEAEAADRALAAWLVEHGGMPAAATTIQVEGERLDGLLEALAGHPRMAVGDEPLEVVDGAMPPLELAGSARHGDRIELRLAAGSPAPLRWGSQLGAWRVDAGRLGRLPVAVPDAVWRDEAIGLMSEGRLELRADEFLAQADAWLDLFASPAPGWLGELAFRAAPARIGCRLEGSLRRIEAELAVDYGSGPQPLPAAGAVAGLPRWGGAGLIETRDREAERAALDELARVGFVADGRRFRLDDGERIEALLADRLPGWRERWSVELGERLATVMERVAVIRPRVEVDPLLSFELSFQTDGGKQVPAAKVRELMRGGRSSVRTANGGTVILSRQAGELVEPLLADLGIVRPEQRVRLDRARALAVEALRERLQGGELALPEPPRLPDDLERVLRPYQRAGVGWLLDRLQRLDGALLADEMGLGKTLQTIAAMRRLREDGVAGPLLVLVPTSLLGNWEREFERWAPDFEVTRLHGPGRDEKRERALAGDVILTSHGTLARDLAFHLRQRYELVVVDEASLLRNPDSETSRAIAKLEAGRRLALTGTPVENRPLDLWSIFRCVAPGYLGSRDDFVARYESEGGARERLGLIAAPYLLRRTKREAAPDLPEKVEIDEWLELGDEARELYAALARTGLEDWERVRETQGEGAARMHLLTLMLRLRQCCLDPALVRDGEDLGTAVKNGRLEQLLEEQGNAGQKTLVFSQFTGYLRILEQKIQGRCGTVLRLDGSTRNRSELVDRFQAEPGPAVFLISLKAGGYGLNLTAADTVVHMDPWWNPAAEAQASDRAHRIGQTRPVTVYRLLARDTIEERVRRLQERKRALIESVRGEDTPANWSAEELRGLI